MLHQDTFTEYPLALGSFAESGETVADYSARALGIPQMFAVETPPKTGVQPNYFQSPLGLRARDLAARGAMDETQKFVVFNLLKNGKNDEAERIILEKESKLANKSKKIYWMDVVNKYLPVGYKLNDQKISGVPNYVVYTGLGVATMFLLKSMRKH